VSIEIKYCKKCECETDRNTQGRCRPCDRASSAAYYAANTDRARASSVRWKAANPERSKAATSAWRKANQEQSKAYAATWYAANLERVRAYRTANPERDKEVRAAWHKKNPDYRKIIEQNRRARKLANGGALSKDVSERLFKLQKGKCPCCGQSLGGDFHLDHIVPIKKGGANEDWNIQLLRKQCNHQKSAKDPVNFMQSRGFLI